MDAFNGFSFVVATKKCSASEKLSGLFVPKGRVIENSRESSSMGNGGSEQLTSLCINSLLRKHTEQNPIIYSFADLKLKIFPTLHSPTTSSH